MTKDRNASLKSSDGNIINTGDTINKFYSPSAKVLNRTRLYEFCKQFESLNGLDEPDYSMELPSDITDKISYNELDEYKEIFIDVSHTLEDVESILSNIPKRGSIIRRIKGIYLNSKIQNKDTNKDLLCNLVFNELLESVNCSDDETSLFQEDTYFAIQCLMYYAFTKCQILDRVPN